MKIWKSLVIFIVFILAAASGYWLYETYFSSKKLSNLELISDNAVFVFETKQAGNTWNTLIQDPVWEILKAFPAFEKLNGQLSELDSLMDGAGDNLAAFSGKETTISLHPTGSETFELLITTDLSEERLPEVLDEIKKRIPTGSKFQTRNYSDISVYEYFDPTNNRQWSIAAVGSLTVVSASSFLIEEAIRFYSNGNIGSFYGLAPSFSLGESSMGKLLLSGKGIATLLKGITANRESSFIGTLEMIQGAVALELTLKEEEIQFSGPVFYGEAVKFTPSIQANLAAILGLIPNETRDVTQINLGNIFETQKLVDRAFTGRSTLSGEIQRKLVDRGVFDSFTGEIYLLELTDLGIGLPNKVLLARTTNAENSLSLFSDFITDKPESSKDFYQDKEIIYISEEEFPAHLFEGKFQGFLKTFITQHEDILIFTNSQQAMKSTLDAIRKGETWGLSSNPLEISEFILPTAGFGKLISINALWDYWTKQTNPSWSSFLQKHAAAFRSFIFIDFRINQIQGEAIATLSLKYDGGSRPEVKTTEAISLQPSNSTTFENPLSYGPKVITNYQDNTEDIVIQDEQHVLHLINAAGEEVYSVQLSGPVISDAFMIDFYKNGKRQLLIATSEKIYGIDRLGASLPEYPLSIKGAQFTHLNLVDYSNAKDYRYFLATNSGDLYLLDKNGNILEGWDPNSLKSKVVGAPSFYRVPGKGDTMVAFTENGELYLFNRRGELQTKSGIPIGEGFKQKLHFTNDSKSGMNQLVGISSNGEIVRINFNGEVIYRNQLVRNDRDNEFLVIPSQDELDYVFISRQFTQVAVLDASESILFETRSSAEGLIYQYFNFGANRKILAITDLIQNFCYLYDFQGNLLTTMPLESSGQIQITHQSSKSQYLIRTINGKKLTEYLLAD